MSPVLRALMIMPSEISFAVAPAPLLRTLLFFMPIQSSSVVRLTQGNGAIHLPAIYGYN